MFDSYNYPDPALPGEELEYEIDWKPWLQEGETIVSVTMQSLDPSVEIDRITWPNMVVTYWVAGGTSNRIASFICTVKTSLTRTEKVLVRLPFLKIG